MAMTQAIVRIVDFCVRHWRAVLMTGVLLAIATAAYDAKRFCINTNIEGLVSQDLS